MLSIGNSNINKILFWNASISSVWLGNTQIWPSGWRAPTPVILDYFTLDRNINDLTIVQNKPG